VWLEDYRLACHAGEATDDLFIIKNLSLYLGDSARTWLEHLPRNKINNWTDLRRVFVGNFQGMYTRPSKQWELRNCKHQPGESLREYIQRFSKCCTELPGATDNDAISVFQSGTTCTFLIHRRLGRRMTRTTRELLDIASNHTDGEEVVATTLNTPQGKGK
jgi:broad specificity phosphatase PhoE